MKRQILDNLKNFRGWRTSRKLVAFAVDDYANVRVDSVAAQRRLAKAGLDLSAQMDRTDAVETRQDLEALFDVLDSVRDRRGRPAALTAYALSANPDFERILVEGARYRYETVPQTFGRLANEQPEAYEGAWALWREGMDRGLLRPQFHGREHLNVELFERKLAARDPSLISNLEQRCLAGLDGDPAMPGVGYTHAFGLHEAASVERHREIIRDGLDLFERVWGFRSYTFTPPAMKLHPALYSHAVRCGVRAIDKPLHCVRPLGDGRSRREINRSGRQRGQDHVTVVRNVVFEPCKPMGFDPVQRAIAQVAAAFRYRKPAIVSSHRANFCGHLDPVNRDRGLDALRQLLEAIVARWPEVEFVSVDRLVEEMDSDA